MIARTFLISIGFISLVLGIIGIFLPIMPTVPFLLLSAYCFSKSSKTIHNWLINHRLLGRFVKVDEGIPVRVKILAISFVWLSISSSAIFIVKDNHLRILLFTIALFITIVILYQKTRK